ncbi:MAG: LytR C-terminal domain-containing protein [Gemmatimonadota bacterium]
MKRGPMVSIVLLGILVLGGAAYAIRARQGAGLTVVGKTDPDLPRAPDSVRIRVQVINTTGKRGLARRATQLLRDRGFDVVEMASGKPMRDTTLVLDRSGHPAWATTVSRILGPAARAEARPDSSRYLDVTVLLGTHWRPPAQPLNP